MNLIEVISTHRKGKCLTELQEELQSLVQSITKTGKPGAITIKLTFEPGAEEGTIYLSDDVITKTPKATKPSTTYYADDDGSLHREDPRQPEFETVVKMSTAANE